VNRLRNLVSKTIQDIPCYYIGLSVLKRTNITTKNLYTIKDFFNKDGTSYSEGEPLVSLTNVLTKQNIGGKVSINDIIIANQQNIKNIINKLPTSYEINNQVIIIFFIDYFFKLCLLIN
jgi:hypothetical protein